MQFLYQHIILGGTFDHFHIGHKSLIKQAFLLGEKVTIGITQEDFIKNKILAQIIEPFHVRKQSVIDFLTETHVFSRSAILPINNIYGSTLKDKTIDAILVSKQTYKNALLINKKRKSLGFLEMKIITAPDVLADNNILITSERIRRGEINRKGYSYFSLFQTKKTLILPEALRDTLRIPFGKIYEEKNVGYIFSKQKPTLIISVGDVVTNVLFKSRIKPDISIIDLKTQRKTAILPFSQTLLQEKKFINNAGTIEENTVKVLQDYINQSITKHAYRTLIISGEEDLLALPAILFAPLSSLVLYGQRNVGIVAVWITEEKKEAVKKLLLQF
jgi:pantetheine-phosphate adenylyltransferase